MFISSISFNSNKYLNIVATNITIFADGNKSYNIFKYPFVLPGTSVQECLSWKFQYNPVTCIKSFE